ncbi:MAG: GDSL-type esterase/lipase family protein [Cystobacterineae bacterium]|nr:GDSL-type esterase/lipase family protein [Cystobacterineae bacterium]
MRFIERGRLWRQWCWPLQVFLCLGLCPLLCLGVACNAGLSALPAAEGENPELPDNPDNPGNPGLPYFPPAPVFEFYGDIAPNLLVSRGKPAFSSVGGSQPSRINDGNYRWDGGGSWTNNGQAAWIAIRVGEGPRRVLVEWSSGANYSYTDTGSGAPAAYSLEVSSDSTHGGDGHWEERVNISDNRVRTRTHLLEFEGMSWVRMRLHSGARANLDEIDVYDATHAVELNGNFDSWFFLGDSITAHAFDRSKAHGSFAENVSRRWPQFFPMMVNGGVGGDRTQHALARLDNALEQHPAIQFWAVCLGSNNVGSGNDGYGLAQFRSELLEITRRIQAAGRIPVLPSIPFIGRWDEQRQACQPTRPDVPKFNRAIEEIMEETGALPGPNLYAYFAANCRQLPDGLHPNAEGYTAMNRLWAEAAASIYGAQQ